MKKRIAGILMALTVFVSSVGVFADSEYAETVEKARYRDWAGRVAKAFLL